MGLIYVIANLIKDKTLTSSTQDTLYRRINLYNERPSLPYRTTAEGALQWICADLLVDTEVTFVGLFNHNLSLTPTLLQLCGGNDCEVCTESKNMKDPSGDGCGDQPTADFHNTYSKVDFAGSHRYWTLQINDTSPDADGYNEIGEWVLGEWKRFPRGILDAPGEPWVRLSPGRIDGPEFFMGNQRTQWGQDWSTYYSECERFELTFTNQNDPCIRDAIHVFLSDVQKTGGRFILIPDDTKPFCYYVIIDNLRDYAERLVYGRTRELRRWRLRLKTLTEGARLL